MPEPVSLHPITEAIEEVKRQLRALRLNGEEREEERKTLIAVLEQVQATLMVACKTGSYFPRWQS